MYKNLKSIIAVLGLCTASSVLAEATLVFENIGADGVKSQQTISLTGRWMRSETKPKGEVDYTLIDSSRMMLFNVDDDKKNYRITRLGRIFWPDAPKEPKFKPTKKKQSVAGVPCIVVQEMGEEGPVAEHCMTGIGPLGLNRRELIAISRLYMSGRRMKTGEIGIATPDERQISIHSKSLAGQQSRKLISLTHEATPDVKMKIPDEYQRIKPDVPRNPINDPEEYRKYMESLKAKQPQETKPAEAVPVE